MSRSGYSNDGELWDLIRWRGAVKAAIRGKRGQAFLAELLAALDAMPARRLIAEFLVCEQGDVCALGAVGKARGLPALDLLDPEEHDLLGNVFGIAPALVAEIEYLNDDDDGYCTEAPEDRWRRMRAWVVKQIKEPAHVH